MKVISLIILIVCASLKLFGQTQHSVFHSFSVVNCSKTDFSKSDSLNCWFYFLTGKNPSYEDSVKPIGQLIFQRTHALQDTISQNLYQSGFLPNFTFQIFNIKDSAYCFKKSQLIQNVSSCTAPDVGGDIIIFGDYIFLNNSVCVHCKRYDNGFDYCRPIINEAFLSVDKRKAASLEQIVNQFPMKGQIIKLPF